MSAVWGSGTCNSIIAATPASGQLNGGDAPQKHSQERCSEITIARKDGSRIRAALSLSGVEVGGQSRTIAFVRDITAEVERRERMALLTLVADRTNRAVVVTDRNLKVVYTNAAFTGLFGYSVEEAKGRQANELLVGRYTDRRTLARLRRWIDEEAGGEEEVLSYDKNGDEIWISANVKAFRDGRGRVKYMFALLTDITETRQLRSLQQLIMSALADEISDYRYRRPALPAGRGDRARCRFLAALRRCRRIGSSAGRPQPSRRLFPGAGWHRDRPGYRLLRIRGILRNAGAGDGY